MFEEVEEFLAFVDECPDALVGRLGAAVLRGDAGVDFAFGLLAERFFEGVHFLEGEGIGNKPVAPLLDVFLYLVEVFCWLW